MNLLEDMKDWLGLHRREIPEENVEMICRSRTYQVTATAQLSIMISRPSEFQDAANIADQLQKRNVLILNIESLAPDVCRRILDFLSGVIYAMEGRMSKVANGTYLLSPSGLELEYGDWAGLGSELDDCEFAVV